MKQVINVVVFFAACFCILYAAAFISTNIRHCKTSNTITVLLSGDDVQTLDAMAQKMYESGDTLCGDALKSVSNQKHYYFYPSK